MKILAVYEGIVGLFPKKISVTLIHAESGATIGSYKMGVEFLPGVFNKPTVMDMGDRSWRITKAVPFQLEGTKKVTLHVVEANDFVQQKFMVPTKTALPVSVSGENTGGLHIPPDDWRQLEFLPVAQLERIQEEMIIIEGLLEAVKEDDGLLGYDTIHERVDIEGATLNIPFDEFFQFVNGVSKDSIGGVADGFVIRSENYHYYGIVKDGVITNLCLLGFDSVEEELASVAEKYELLLADWCNGGIIF